MSPSSAGAGTPRSNNRRSSAGASATSVQETLRALLLQGSLGGGTGTVPTFGDVHATQGGRVAAADANR